MNPSESGYIFTSKGFQYELSERKKDGWDVTIVPTERSYGEKFTLSVFENGSATLMVTSNNRQPINFRGYITGEEIINSVDLFMRQNREVPPGTSLFF